MSELKAIGELMQYLASDPEARRMIDEVFDRCGDESPCMECAAYKFSKWALKWVFGVRRDPVEIARDIHSCMEEGGDGGEASG